MKHLKTYENFFDKLRIMKSILLNKYEVGDYIECIDVNNNKKKKGKIVKRFEDDSVLVGKEFEIEIIDDDGKYIYINTSIEYIIRKLTSKEIKEIKLKTTANKYNL